MDTVGALGSPTGANSNRLGLPSPCPWDEDDESLGREGIWPKSSPVPRRRSSASSDDSQPPPSSSRRVSFADTFGLNLVSVKQFDAWAVTVPPESHLNEAKEYFMVPLFVLPQTRLEVEMRVLEKKIELENLELLPGTTTLRGVIRVLNLCLEKMVYVRTSLDSWRSHFDLLAEYVPGSHDGEMDCFSFKLTLVPPFGEEGARVDFCLRYETSLGTFWANNNGNNFTMYCCEKTKEKPQNETESRRKSCLRGSSSNVFALTTNNMEFPEINLNSGQATGPEPQNTIAAELQKESKELLEEISRNRSRRNRRKAARLTKVKEHFARREEEEKQGTKTKGSEVRAETSMQEDASVPAKESCSLSQQTPPGPPTCNQISPAPAECLESPEHKEDSTYTVTFKQRDLEQQVQDEVIHYEPNLSTAQTDSYLDETDDLSHQLVSVNLPVLGRQKDLSTGKDVEKAWEDFEQDAKQRIRCKTDKEENTSKEKPAHRENVSLKTNPSVPQFFSQKYVFGTVVAPLYHQVFKNIQFERKDFIQRAFQEDRTFKELNDRSPRAVTPPESDQAPMRQNTETGLESCVSTKQTQHDCESTEQNPANTKKETKKSLSDTYINKNVQGAVSSHSCIKEHSTDPTNNQRQTKVENIYLQTNVIGNNLSLNISSQFPQESQNPRNTSFVVPQNDFNSFTTQTQQQMTSILNPNQVELPKSVISERSTEISNLSAMPLVQNENTYNLPQFPEGPKMLQTLRITFDSSDDHSDSDCSEMRLNNEIFNFPESECSKAVESHQMNESKEQKTLAFCSRPQTFNITDGTNDFYGECDKTTMIEEIENIQKWKLVKNYEKECPILEDLVEEEKGNQAIQIENQEVNQKKKEEQESAKKEEIGGGIWNIVDELKYIDDEEAMDMGNVEMEHKHNQISDFNHQSYAVVQPLNSLDQQSYAVNEQSNSENQQSDSVNEQSDSENQKSYAVTRALDSMNQQSDLENQQSDSVKQQSNSIYQQSDSVNEQSHSQNQQSDSEYQQSDLENHQSDSEYQQLDSVNQQSQSDSENQHSVPENEQSDLEIQQADPENQQSDPENQQSDLENQQSDLENQQSDLENHQSDSEYLQSDSEYQQSDSENQQLDSVNRQSQSDLENQQSDPENQQSDLENQQLDSVNEQSDPENQQLNSVNQHSDSENQQSDLENHQSNPLSQQADSVKQHPDSENQQSDPENQQSDPENQQSDSVNKQSDLENQQSDQENEQSDLENQQLDLVNEQSDSVNKQSYLENQQSDSVNEQSDLENQQSDLENEQSDLENRQSDPENQQSDPENQQSDLENQQSDSVNEQSDLENQQSDLENEQSDLENRQSDPENQQSDPENQQSDLENQQSDSVNEQSDLENQQSDPENQQSDLENQQSDPENQQSDPQNQQSDPENQQSDPENQQSDSVSRQSVSVNRQSDSENQLSDLENQQSDSVNEQSDLENQQSDPENQQSDPENQQSDSVNEQSDLENQQSDPENQQSDPENQQSDPENQQSDPENQQSDPENQQSDPENQQPDSVSQSVSVNRQSDSENQQSDLENQQSDLENQQLDSVNQQSQSDSENQHSVPENEQSDLEIQQSDPENQQSDPENQQSDLENQQSDPENQQSDPENQQSDPENQQSDPENQQSDSVSRQSVSVNRQSDSENQLSDLENQQSDSVNEQSDLENQQSDPENQQSDPENQQSDSVNEQSDLENQQSDPENQQSDPENQQSDPENQQSDPENQQPDSEYQQSDSVNEQSDLENQQSDSVDEQSDLENQQSDPENQQSDPENQQSDPENQQSDPENQQPDSVSRQSVSVNRQSDSENQQSDLENQQSDLENQQANSVHRQTIEQQPKALIIKSNSESLHHSSIELDIAEEHQSTEQSRSGDEDSSSAEEAADEETDIFWNESTKSGGEALSASIHGMRNDWDHLEFIDKELTVCHESEKLQNKCKPNDENMEENMECQSKHSTDAEKDVEDNTSTESLVDDEMDLYLTCLRNSQQSVFRDGLANVNYGKRHSVSRGRSMSLTMPSISESVDEDQPNSSLEKASNTEDITELERATLTLVEGNEHVIGCNVLWWKEFLSYNNMSRFAGYSFLLILFLVVAYYYDFAACFALYLLTVYWLFKQSEDEPVIGARRGER